MNNELYHHGIKGQRWGIRRFQNEDGTLTAAGKKRAGRYERKSKEYDEWFSRRDKSLLRKRADSRDSISRSYDRKIYKYDEKIKYGNKSDAKKQKLISKRDSTKAKQQAKLKDFDEGTAYIKEAMKKRKENYTNVWNQKMKAVYDPSIKNSPEYKRAKKYFNRQNISDKLYGTSYTLLAESMAVAGGYEYIRD